MVAIARPTMTLTAAAAVALGSAVAAAPPALLASPVGVPTIQVIDANNIALTGFIADLYNSIQPIVADVVDTTTDIISIVPIVGPPIASQIDILYTYAQQAVGGTVYWVDDLVTPLVTGNFWPLSGAPGNYIANAINSTVDWAGGLINTGIDFVNAEINYFFGWIPNIPALINDVINTVTNVINTVIGWIGNPFNIVNDVINAVENVINWIIGWIPFPLAAVEAPAAAAVAASVATARGGAVEAAPAPAAVAESAPAQQPAPEAAPSVAAEVVTATEAAPEAAVEAVEAVEVGEPSAPTATESRRSARSAPAADAPADVAGADTTDTADNATAATSADTADKADARGGARKHSAGRG